MKKITKRLRAFISNNWHLILFFIICFTAIAWLLLYKLGSIVGGLSSGELALQQKLSNDAITLGSLLQNPLFLPYYLAVYIMQFSPFSGPSSLRGISALFGFLGSLGFFYILKRWYTARIAFMGTVLFVTSGWFLHTSRYADPAVSYLLLPLLIAGVIALQYKARAKWAMLAVIIFGLFSLYIPGLLWFIIPAVIIQRKLILKALRLQPYWFNATVGLLCTLMLVPLVFMIISPPAGQNAVHNLLQLLGLPSSFPSPLQFLNEAKQTLSDILIYNNLGPQYVVGRLPWLDIASSTFLLLGMIQFGKHYKLDRSKLIAITGITGLTLVSLGVVSSVILLPLLYLLIVEGAKWLLDTWLSVFPRNPFARGFGIAVMTVIVVFIGTYHIHRYFEAWGHSPETRSVYNRLP